MQPGPIKNLEQVQPKLDEGEKYAKINDIDRCNYGVCGLIAVSSGQ